MLLRVNDLSKRYALGRTPFAPLSFEINEGVATAICGPNGAGKSTLVKMIVGLTQPSSGTVELVDEDGKNNASIKDSCGFVAPYLQLYEEFSPLEHLELDASLRAKKLDAEYAQHLLKTFGIAHRASDPLSSFSSGMKQRFRYCLAAIHRPKLLILDEPTTNLDESGIERVYEFLREGLKNKIMMIIATNEARDRMLCANEVHLSPQTV